eukprot:1943902-Rhodomonas_salina.2
MLCTAPSYNTLSTSDEVQNRWHMIPNQGHSDTGSPVVTSGTATWKRPSEQQLHEGPPAHVPCPEQPLSRTCPSYTAFGKPSHPEHVELSPSHTWQESKMVVPSGRPAQSTTASVTLMKPVCLHWQSTTHTHSTVPALFVQIFWGSLTFSSAIH